MRAVFCFVQVFVESKQTSSNGHNCANRALCSVHHTGDALDRRLQSCVCLCLLHRSRHTNIFDGEWIEAEVHDSDARQKLCADNGSLVTIAIASQLPFLIVGLEEQEMACPTVDHKKNASPQKPICKRYLSHVDKWPALPIVNWVQCVRCVWNVAAAAEFGL